MSIFILVMIYVYSSIFLLSIVPERKVKYKYYFMHFVITIISIGCILGISIYAIDYLTKIFFDFATT